MPKNLMDVPHGSRVIANLFRGDSKALVAGESKTFPTQKLQRRIHDFVIGVSRGTALQVFTNDIGLAHVQPRAQVQRLNDELRLLLV